MGTTETPYKSQFFGEVPFVCIKIPTGGGKTLVASHAVGEISNSVLRDKLGKGIVMWFVPSEAIKSQTLKKLKDRSNMHRAVLDETFDTRVKILSNEEALRLRRRDVEDNLCIIVSSLDAFRKEKELQSKYKVYQENGELMDHFQNIESLSLERDEDGTVVNSLANVIRLYNPLIVIDEGHRTKTELSIKFLRGLNPSFILEFTATPREESNVLVQIHSSELKDENMVKIPIILESLSLWQEAIRRGKIKRDELENIAKREESRYIRPIALIQAQQEKQSDAKITVSDVKEFLLSDCLVNEDEIAVKTSKNNELEGVDLIDSNCNIRYIITVNALAEGWDCPFAYILISVANIGSRISVEQIIGRIVRLPYAEEKNNNALNYSYIFASARNFNEAASMVISGLDKNGYGKGEVISQTRDQVSYDLEVHRTVDEDLKVPLLSLNGEKLEFADLIGEDFELSKQNVKFNFDPLYDSDGRIKLDIESEDKWIKERQIVLNLTYSDKNFSKSELVSWIDKKIRFKILDKADKSTFIRDRLDDLLSSVSLTVLSINRFYLADRLKTLISELLINVAREKFQIYFESEKISIRRFGKFPDKVILSEKIPENYKKNYYSGVEPLNGEEKSFVNRLDSEILTNIQFWLRNRERKDPFYLQGWRPNRFYPDFIAVSKTKKFIAIEWKGLDRVNDEDTKYKQELAKKWEELGKGDLYFFLATNENVDEVLNKISKL